MVLVCFAVAAGLVNKGKGTNVSTNAISLAAGAKCKGRAGLAGAAAEVVEGAAQGMPVKEIAEKAAVGGVFSTSLSGILTGGWRGVIVGTKGNTSCDITYDCWKKVVRNRSDEPSDGILLKDLLDHPFVAGYEIADEDTSDLPYIVIENIWKERFEIQYLYLRDSKKIVCHANPLNLV